MNIRVAPAFTSSRLFPRAAAFVVLLAVLQTVILFPILPSRLHVHEGEIASQTVRAPHAFSYDSDVQRRQLQSDAVKQVPASIAYDVNVKSNQLAKLSDLLNRIAAVRADTTLTHQQVIDSL